VALQANAGSNLKLSFGSLLLATGLEFPVEAGIFSLRHRVQPVCGAHPVSCPVGTGTPSPGVKRSDRKADHSSLSSAEVKNTWSYTSTHTYVFLAWYFVKHRDDFTFYFF
jgi:hypothetical protein